MTTKPAFRSVIFARTLAMATFGLATIIAARCTAAEANLGELTQDQGLTSDARFHLDVEIDPTAYVFRGYSLHVGLGWKRVRLDLGAFAMAVPHFFQSNDAFDVSFDGFGAKLQYFPFAEQRGAFLGVDAGMAWQLTQRTDSDLAARSAHVSLGVNAGWRFALGDHFYVTPWIGVSRAFGAGNVALGGTTYESNPITVFPAVHVGYRFK